MPTGVFQEAFNIDPDKLEPRPLQDMRTLKEVKCLIEDARVIATKYGDRAVLDCTTEKGERISLIVSHISLAFQLAKLDNEDKLVNHKVHIKLLGKRNKRYDYQVELIPETRGNRGGKQ